MKLTTLAAVFVTCLAGCRAQTTQDGAQSSVAAVNITMPQLGNAKQYLTSYRLNILPKDATCANATQIKDTTGALGNAITNSVVKGCDYLVSLELGQQSGSTFTAYYSNVTSPEAERLLNKADLEKTPASFSAKLHLTDDGRKIPALVALGNVTTPATTDVSIDVTLISSDAAAVTGRYDCVFTAVDGDGTALDVGGADAKASLTLDPAQPLAVHFGGYQGTNGASLVVNYTTKTLTLLVSDVVQAAKGDGVSTSASSVAAIGAPEMQAEVTTTRRDNSYKTTKSSAKCTFVKS